MKAVVRDVMSSCPVSVRKNASFKEIAVRLREYRVSAFPVLECDGAVMGVVSEADMLAKEAVDAGHRGQRGLLAGIVHHRAFRKAAGVTAGDLMTSPAVTVGPDDTVEHAARLMYTRGLKRLAVAGADGRLTGIVSRTAVLVVFHRLDEEIRLEIAGQLIPPACPSRAGTRSGSRTQS
jgi:CBS domain-containing protein